MKKDLPKDKTISLTEEIFKQQETGEE